MNPVLRSDLRFALSSPKALTVHTIFLSVLAALAMLAVPPELGRVDQIGQEGLLRTLLIVQTVLAAYFTSACACREIAIEGEKSVWDLAASPFSSAVIAWGKVGAVAAFGGILNVLAAPLMAVVAGIRGEPLSTIVQAAVVAVPFAAAMGSLGALYGGLFDSDFARSFVHWVTLVAFVVAATALPSPWDLISPVHSIGAAARSDAGPAVALVAVGYGTVAVLTVWIIRLRVETIRREGRAT